jgi:hypothetical protein
VSIKTIYTGVQRSLPHLRIPVFGGKKTKIESSVLKVFGLNPFDESAWQPNSGGTFDSADGKTSYPLNIIKISCQGFF